MHDIEQLVGNSTPEQRAELFDNLIMRLTATGTALPSLTAAFCNSVIMHLLQNAEEPARAIMAMRVARESSIPEALLASLAVSDISVAAPVLKYSTGLSERTLTEIARGGSDDHLVVIARRGDLTEAVCDAVLQRGSDEVALALVNNAAAKFNSRAIRMLARRAERTPALEEALCGRRDLPRELAQALLQTVSVRLHSELGATMGEFDPETTQLALRTGHAGSLPEEGDRGGLSHAAIADVSRLAAEGQLTEAKLAEFIAENRLDLAMCAFARFSDLEPAIAHRILFSVGSETLAVAAKAIPLSPENYLALVRLVRETDPMSEDEIRALSDHYQELPVATARRVMQFHRRRHSFQAGAGGEPTASKDAPVTARAGR